MSRSITWLLSLLIVLTAVNLGLTAYVAFRSPQAATDSARPVGNDVVSEAQAAALAKEFVVKYNNRDADAIYDGLDRLAQVQLTREQTAAQLDKLHAVLGNIDDFVYTNVTAGGPSDGQTFYNLNYKVKLTGAISHGSMKLVVIRRDSGLGVVGFFVNGSEQMSGN